MLIDVYFFLEYEFKKQTAPCEAACFPTSAGACLMSSNEIKLRHNGGVVRLQPIIDNCGKGERLIPIFFGFFGQ